MLTNAAFAFPLEIRLKQSICHFEAHMQNKIAEKKIMGKYLPVTNTSFPFGTAFVFELQITWASVYIND